MPLEHREIKFCNREVISAILELNKEARILKLGNIVGLKVVDSDGVASAVVSHKMSAVGRVEELTVSAEILAAALIRQCRVERIPLPRSVRKQLVRAGDGLALHVEIKSPSYETAEPPPAHQVAAAAY